MKCYLVFRDYTFLQLRGPFAYPQWVASAKDANVFSFAGACIHAHAHGGSVVDGRPFSIVSPFVGMATPSSPFGELDWDPPGDAS